MFDVKASFAAGNKTPPPLRFQEEAPHLASFLPARSRKSLEPESFSFPGPRTPPSSSQQAPLLPHTLPYLGFLTVGAHLLLRLQARGPHLCSPNPGLGMCTGGGGGVAAPQRRRERKEWGLGTLPGLYSSQYMKSMQMRCKNSMQISTSFTSLSSGSRPPGSHDP